MKSHRADPDYFLDDLIDRFLYVIYTLDLMSETTNNDMTWELIDNLAGKYIDVDSTRDG